MRPTLLVLAAGIGSRYGGLKQIDPVGPSGEIIIDYSVYDAIRAGFGKIVFVIRKEIEKDFKECVSGKYEDKIPVSYCYQELDILPSGFKHHSDRIKPWGTGHAILVAKDEISEPFAVINADDYYGKSGYELLSNRLSTVSDSHCAEYCMVGFILNNTLSEYGTVSRGLCETNGDLYLTSVIERTKIEKCAFGAKFYDEDGTAVNLSGSETVSMNMWGFTPSLFGHLERLFIDFLKDNLLKPKSEFFIPYAVNTLINEKKARVKVMQSPDPWFGITYKEDKPFVINKLRELISKGIYPDRLF